MSESPPHAAAAKRLLGFLDVDGAVAFAVMLRGWQLIGGAVSMLMIAFFFTKVEQGFYYTFSNLLALQIFFELSLSIVITNVSSHEWSRLKLDAQGRIKGDHEARSRLVSLGRLIFRWFGLASLLFVFLVGASGLYFFSLKPAVGVNWREPWLVTVAASGLLLWTLPFNSMLEGCNQVTAINRFRLIQAILANATIWTAMYLGAGLWALAASSIVRFVCEALLLSFKYRRFFEPFWFPPESGRLRWRTELWPMQWRLAVSGVFGYFAINSFGLVMFHFFDPQTAGRMGMTWTLVSVMQAAALAWVQTRVPRMGMLIADRRFEELDQLFRRSTMISLGVLAVGGVCAWLGVWIVNELQWKLAGRLLSPTATGVLILAALAHQIPHCQAMYIRAHRRDTLLLSSILSSSLIGLLVWWLGGTYGPIGAVSGYLAVALLVTLPFQAYLWRRCRREWH